MKDVPVDIDALSRIIEETAGFDIDAVGRETFLHAASSLAARARIESPGGYAALVESSLREREKLIDRLLVHETWFFRDEEPFAYLRKHARTEWAPAHPEGVFRVLSAPCSTGEEAYSAVMALLDEGLLPGRFQVDAADVSRKGIETARHAVYGAGSFREKRFPAPDRRFTPCGSGFKLDEAVAGLARFARGNIFDPGFLADREPYDAVFCRNLIVYLVRAAREKVFAAVDRLLAPGGVLFAGSAEVAFFRSMGYTTAPHPRSFACRKPMASKTETDAGKVSRRARRTPGAAPPAPLRRPVVPERPVIRETSAPTASYDSDIARAGSLADAGRLEEALAVCGDIARAGDADARVYALSGVIFHALGRTAESEENLLKAVYLDPHHYDALLHLSLLCQERGDTARAALYRDRARRQHERELAGE